MITPYEVETYLAEIAANADAPPPPPVEDDD
jgi:hypothetical protein